jgi:hypothetical protein
MSPDCIKEPRPEPNAPIPTGPSVLAIAVKKVGAAVEAANAGNPRPNKSGRTMILSKSSIEL